MSALEIIAIVAAAFAAMVIVALLVARRLRSVGRHYSPASDAGGRDVIGGLNLAGDEVERTVFRRS